MRQKHGIKGLGGGGSEEADDLGDDLIPSSRYQSEQKGENGRGQCEFIHFQRTCRENMKGKNFFRLSSRRRDTALLSRFLSQQDVPPQRSEHEWNSSASSGVNKSYQFTE